MVLIRSVLIILAVMWVSGCTSVTVKPVDRTLELKHVCIKDGQKTCFDGDMMGVIRDGFKSHGITTQVYTRDLPSECKYHLTYMCKRTWDIAMYMHHAELHLFQAQEQIGYAEYHLNGAGGFSLTKFDSTKKKIDPVIDQLFGGNPTVSKSP